MKAGAMVVSPYTVGCTEEQVHCDRRILLLHGGGESEPPQIALRDWQCLLPTLPQSG